MGKLSQWRRKHCNSFVRQSPPTRRIFTQEGTGPSGALLCATTQGWQFYPSSYICFIWDLTARADDTISVGVTNVNRECIFILAGSQGRDALVCGSHWFGELKCLIRTCNLLYRAVYLYMNFSNNLPSSGHIHIACIGWRRGQIPSIH